MMKRKPKLLIVFLLLTFLVSCSGIIKSNQLQNDQQTYYKALMASKTAYDTGFTTLALLDSQGKLPAVVKENAIKAGNVYMAAHNIAVQTILNNKTPDLDQLQQLLNAFLIIIQPFMK